jgi:uncharacterized protein with von Willebrand factor type A (vWA) domain
MTDPVPVLIGFARALKAAGIPITPDRSQSFLRAVALVGVDERLATYWAGRATLCTGPDDLTRYDQVFDAWFDPDAAFQQHCSSDLPEASAPMLPSSEGGEGQGSRTT